MMTFLHVASVLQEIPLSFQWLPKIPGKSMRHELQHNGPTCCGRWGNWRNYLTFLGWANICQECYGASRAITKQAAGISPGLPGSEEAIATRRALVRKRW